jgi:hypothetical protein
LNAIEADVAVRQKNTHTILLDRVRISLRQSVVVAHAANTKNIIHHAIAVNLLVRKIGPGSEWAVVGLDALHPKIVCTIAEGRVKNGISVGGRKSAHPHPANRRVDPHMERCSHR